MPVGEKQIFRFGPFHLDTQCGQLRRDGVGLKLQGQPVQILEILLENAGRLVTREEIRQRLWASDTFVDFDHSLNTAIKKLRQALGDEAETPRYIETLPKRGYRFIGEVTAEEARQENHGAPPIAADDVVSPVVTNLADAAITAETESRSRTRRIRVVMVSVAAFLGIAACGYWVTKPPPMPRIVNAHALTKTGFRKPGRLVTDGVGVYFQEDRPSGFATLQARISGGEPAEMTVSKRDISLLQDISPDGSSLLTTRANPEGEVDTWIQPLPAGPARLIMKDARWPLWTPDGKSILFARNNDKDLYRSNPDGTDVRRLATLPDITYPAISPDGRRIRFTVHPKYDLWEARADGSGAHAILPESGEGTTGLNGNWSPDGKYFFFAYGRERDDLWVLPEGRRWWQKTPINPVPLTFGPMSIEAPIVSKDGRQLFAKGVERHGELSVYDKKSAQFVPYLNGISACYVDFSWDGKWIAYVSYPEGTLWRSRIDGTEPMQLTAPPVAVINPRWSADGKLIVFTDLSNGDRSKLATEGVDRIYVVSADGGGPVLLLVGPFGDPTWSPDGRSIAYDYHAPGVTTEIRILDLQTARSTTLPGSQGFWSPRWSPDGKYLVALGAKLGLFSFTTQKWETLASGDFGWPAWSHDSQFVYAQNGQGDSLVRFNIIDGKMEEITSLKYFHSAAYFFWKAGWYGLTPDDRPMSTRDTEIDEIYAFDLEYK